MALFDDSRSAWGARRPRNAPTIVAPSRRTEYFAHWNGPPTGLLGKSHSACLAAVRGDQAFHMDSNGWSDIGYNGLICPHARAIEGRGVDAVGAHCPNHNTSGYGIQLMVGKGEVATPAMLARARRLYDDLCRHSGHALAKKGHRDGFATECPGDQIESWVKAGMPAPTTTAPTSEEDTMAADLQQVITDIAERVWHTKIYNPLLKDAQNPKGKAVEALVFVQSINTGVAAAREDAAVARALAEAQAKAGKPLTQADIDAIAKATVDALGKDYTATVELTPKEN